MSSNRWNSNRSGHGWNRNNNRGYTNRNTSQENRNRNRNNNRRANTNDTNYYGRTNSSHTDFSRYRDRSSGGMDDLDDEPKNKGQNQNQSILTENLSYTNRITTGTRSNSNSMNTSRHDAVVSNASWSNQIRRPKWEDMTHDERVMHQLTSAHYDYDKLPKIKKNNDKEMVNNKKKDAFKHAMKQVMAKMKEMCGDEEEDDDDDDDDDSSDASDFSMYSDGYDDGGPYSSSKRRKKELKYSEKDVSLFFKSLMNNVVFDMGFQVWGIHSDDDKNCWCPCGKHMVAWRECFVIEHLAGKGSDAYCEAPSKMTPLGLMGHLRKKGENCPMHYGIAAYLTSRYGKLRGTGHKGLYMMGDKKYKAAEAAEKREAQSLLMKAIKDKEEAERKYQESEESKMKLEEEKKVWMKKLEKSNPDLAVEMKALEDNFKLLNLDTRENEIEESDFNTSDKAKLEWFDELIEDKISTLQCGLTLPKIQPAEKGVKAYEKNRKILEVHQTLDGKFDINKIFETMEKKEQVLFQYDDMKKFLLPQEYWIVRFLAFNEKDIAAKKNEDRAIDDGGPTREFFANIWKNLEQLSLSYDVHTKKTKSIEIKLFKSEKSGLVPIENSFIDHKIKRIVKHGKYSCEEIRDRVKIYYKAVGIILFRALICHIPIAPNVVPSFYRNVLLRNVEPKHVGKYSKRQMLTQFAEIGLKLVNRDEEAREEVLTGSAKHIVGKTLKELHEEGIVEKVSDSDKNIVIDMDNFFTIFLQGKVDNKSIALNALKGGLALGGMVNLQLTLGITSLSYVSDKFFAKPGVEANDLIDRLSFSEANHIDLHKPFFDTVLKEVITEMTSDERKDFVYFCTGYNYLPNRERESQKFTITVEFNFDEMEEMSLPVSHTCVNTLKLPGLAYGNDKEMFKSKLSQAMSNSKGFSIA